MATLALRAAVEHVSISVSVSASALSTASRRELCSSSATLHRGTSLARRSVPLHRASSSSGNDHSHILNHRPRHIAYVATTKELATELALPDSIDDEDVKDEETEEEDDESLVPNAFEIQSLIMELCDETSVAELKVKVGSFELHVRRDVEGRGRASSPLVALAPPVPSPPMLASMAASPPQVAMAPRVVEESDEEEVDEGLAYVTSPKVGIFRKGRFYKGKHGKPMVAAGVQVKAGQVVGYLEQLGTQLAIESEHAGEVVKYTVEDGDPVGFGESLIAVRPDFIGIKKLT